jgi:hypothetical protein
MKAQWEAASSRRPKVHSDTGALVPNDSTPAELRSGGARAKQRANPAILKGQRYYAQSKEDEYDAV